MSRDGSVADGFEVAAAGVWLLLAVEGLSDAGVSALLAIFLFLSGSFAALVWFVRSAVIASRPPIRDRLRLVRWCALPAAFAITFWLARCSVTPMLRLRFALSRSELERFRTWTGYGPKFETRYVNRSVGYFWVETLWTDGGTCWTLITGSGVYSLYGLKYCKPGGWSGQSDVHELGDNWYAWWASSGIN